MSLNLMQQPRARKVPGKRGKASAALPNNAPAADNDSANDSTAAVTASRKAKLRRMAFMPTKVETRTAVNGKPYVYARGTVVYRRKQFTYTVMVPFFHMTRFDDAFRVVTDADTGAELAETAYYPIEIEGYRREILATPKGKPFAVAKRPIYIEAIRLLGVLDTAHSARGSEEPSRSLAAHERRGHYRRQHYGPANMFTKVIWIDDVQVGALRKAA